MTYEVHAEWDCEADAWVVTSDDIPGLVIENATVDGLVEIMKDVVPDLLGENSVNVEGDQVSVELVCGYRSPIKLLTPIKLYA